MNNKRVYIMDCGGFIKIGISNNVDKRKNQIDYPVKQYYSTEPIDNALEIEKYMHDVFHPVNKKDAPGREYFNIDFETARNFLISSLSADEKSRKEVVESIHGIYINNPQFDRFNSQFYKMVSKVMNMSEGDAAFLVYAAEGLLQRKRINREAELKKLSTEDKNLVREIELENLTRE